MELILTSKELPTHPGCREVTWFLDLKEGHSLTSICSGDKDYCLREKSKWSEALHIDGSETHQKLRDLGLR